jgi:hypothetical protein
VVDLKVAIPPSVRIKQVLCVPTSSNKLDKERHLQAVRRYILQRWHERGANMKPRTVISTLTVSRTPMRGAQGDWAH